MSFYFSGTAWSKLLELCIESKHRENWGLLSLSDCLLVSYASFHLITPWLLQNSESIFAGFPSHSSLQDLSQTIPLKQHTVGLKI